MQCDSVSNHQPLFRRRSKKTSKLRVTGLCEGNSPGTGEFPAHKWPVTRKMFPFDDVIMKFALCCVLLWFSISRFNPIFRITSLTLGQLCDCPVSIKPWRIWLYALINKITINNQPLQNVCIFCDILEFLPSGRKDWRPWIGEGLLTMNRGRIADHESGRGRIADHESGKDCTETMNRGRIADYESGKDCRLWIGEGLQTRIADHESGKDCGP